MDHFSVRFVFEEKWAHLTKSLSSPQSFDQNYILSLELNRAGEKVMSLDEPQKCNGVQRNWEEKRLKSLQVDTGWRFHILQRPIINFLYIN